ncbi:hypothetical protein K432DRAFT_376725 [Lepidopterella palustris CBS 459.81]|uniref:Uncharacterized protein n=1 Tax=Lepidopterella palustris CBS 459.81 TaxID=1314670 RepID=A0A8E2JKU9_9PEZI|nr:hypothetical protein K432DRAFT_376725 [Lepidopterella palustris CBS 459.81]
MKEKDIGLMRCELNTRQTDAALGKRLLSHPMVSGSQKRAKIALEQPERAWTPS